ncbi:MAG: hypothetical protein V1915_00105 [Candidatus Bathyarchaeota archaeon]
MSEENDKKDEKKKESEKKDDPISDLLSLKIFGVEIGDLLKDIDGVREKLLAQQGELRKKYGDKVHVDIGIKVSGLDERRLSYHGNRSFADLAKERTEWKKRIPTVTITKEDVKKAKEELEKKKQEEKDSESS